MALASLRLPNEKPAVGVPASARPPEQWQDSLSPAALGIVALLASIDAIGASFFGNTSGFASEMVRLHIGLPNPLAGIYIFALDMATGVVIVVAIAWIVDRFAKHGALQYGALAVAVTLASAARTLVMYTQATDYTFELARIVPVGFFSTIPRSPENDAILYSTMNRLMLLWGVWAYPAALAGMLGSAYLYFRAQMRGEAALAQSRIEAERLREQASEARLARLEAQIEPHFLFNTLANVKRLYQSDRQTGERMLDNLMRYLEQALPRMRDDDATLGRDLALTEAYLGVQQIRMGARLAYRIDVSEALRCARLPPMVVLTLAENAIKHALNPLPEGGTVAIRAHADDGRLTVEVADDGGGFTRSSGGGTGLANLRARLAMAYGDRAVLRLGLNAPRGVVATIELPFEPAAQSSQ